MKSSNSSIDGGAPPLIGASFEESGSSGSSSGSSNGGDDHDYIADLELWSTPLPFSSSSSTDEGDEGCKKVPMANKLHDKSCMEANAATTDEDDEDEATARLSAKTLGSFAWRAGSSKGCSEAWKWRAVWTLFVALVVVVVVMQLPSNTDDSTRSRGGMDNQLQGGENGGFQPTNGENQGGLPQVDGGSSGSGDQTTTAPMPPNNGELPASEPETVTANPTFNPTFKATNEPTFYPTIAPSHGPTQGPTRVTFVPGELTVEQNGLRLSTGLTSRLLAASGYFVSYAGAGTSEDRFHFEPDAGACFADPDPNNPGGWIYVNNAEVGDGGGGVGAMTFNAAGEVIYFQQVLKDTTDNCGGGRTPWGAWISCEEYSNGRCWQVDPTGVRTPQPITLGNDFGGNFESFAYDTRDESDPTFYITEDLQRGAMQRFRPHSPDWSDPWSILLGEGTTDYLVLNHDEDDWWEGGTFEWTTDRGDGRNSAEQDYPNAEGIDIYEGILYFISKEYRAMYILDLDTFEFKVESTDNGLFEGGPDQIKRILNDDSSNLLFFTEDGGDRAGVHARNELGIYLTILESEEYQNETTGLSFSPDGTAMYIAYQKDGLFFEIRREDGLPFYGRSLNVAYHARATAK